ncbi:MAG: GNAT family N-acetyltransferase [Planctomycetota bacterium]|jgi:RimJ/RimL family protein N-acetyltransferase
MERPRIETERLILRPFTEDDVPEVARMAGERAIADTTLNLPHPYAEGDARTWIEKHEPGAREGKQLTLAIQHRDGPLLGAVGLAIAPEQGRAELGYWVGVEHWNRGYATEAAGAVVSHAFMALGLRRIHACHLTRNAASGRVMEKIGMRREGVLREHVLKWDVPEDIALWAVLGSDVSGDADGDAHR